MAASAPEYLCKPDVMASNRGNGTVTLIDLHARRRIADLPARDGTKAEAMAFTPDGPRGPAGEVQPGVILAAAATGFPIQPVAVAVTRGKRLRSWDRFLVPLPLSTVHFVYGEPLTVERRGDQAEAAAELKRRLDAAEDQAEGLAKER